MDSQELKDRFEELVVPLKHIENYPVFLAQILWKENELPTPISGD